MDPSQAPDGQDTIQLYGPAPVDVRDGWAVRRDEAVEGLLRQASEYAPALGELELGRHVESPADLSARTTTVNGCLYHVDHLATRLGPLRPALGAGGYRTPVRGLYLSGAGFHPSGGVSGLPGKLAAQVALRDAG
jgi:phytoene dehydrogenase-like protein